jgi:hypothetical protein
MDNSSANAGLERYHWALSPGRWDLGVGCHDVTTLFCGDDGDSGDGCGRQLNAGRGVWNFRNERGRWSAVNDVPGVSRHHRLRDDGESRKWWATETTDETNSEQDVDRTVVGGRRRGGDITTRAL